MGLVSEPIHLVPATLTGSLRLPPRARFSISRRYGRGVTMGPYLFPGLPVLIVWDSARESVGVWVRFSYPPPDIAPNSLNTVSVGSTSVQIKRRDCWFLLLRERKARLCPFFWLFLAPLGTYQGVQLISCRS